MKESKAPSLGRTPAQKFFDKWQGLFYLIPWIIGFVVFKAIPFGQSLYYSFTPEVSTPPIFRKHTIRTACDDKSPASNPVLRDTSPVPVAAVNPATKEGI